jgi:hypothetical protein
MRTLFLAMAVLMSVLVAECGISLGDLDQFVINYNVTVTNDADQPATVTVKIADKSRSTTLEKGKSVEVISFKPGPWSVSIEGSAGRIAALHQAFVSTKLRLDGLKDKNSKVYDALDNDLDDIEDAIGKGTNDAIGAGRCQGRMDDRAGDLLSIHATNNNATHPDTVRWSC